MSKSPLRVAVAGAGYFARFHHEAWVRMPDADLVAICDIDAAKASAAAAAAGTVGYGDLTAMLDAVRPDLLDIATPPESHRALAAAAAGRGLPAICQKPLAPTIAEACEIVETAENAGVLLAVHENFRFQPWYREFGRQIAAGRLGDPHGITFRLRPGDGQGPAAYLDRQPYFQDMERFLIHETGIHFIDTFRFLMGEITAVYAELRRVNPAIAGEDAGIVTFNFANGAAGLFDGNRLNDHVADNPRLTMGEMWLEGSDGVLRLDGDGRIWWKPHGGNEAKHEYTWHDRGSAGDCVAATQAHIVAHLHDGATLENDGRSYLRNMEIEEAIYRSAAEGCRIPV